MSAGFFTVHLTQLSMTVTVWPIWRKFGNVNKLRKHCFQIHSFMCNDLDSLTFSRPCSVVSLPFTQYNLPGLHTPLTDFHIIGCKTICKWKETFSNHSHIFIAQLLGLKYLINQACCYAYSIRGLSLSLELWSLAIKWTVLVGSFRGAQRDLCKHNIRYQGIKINYRK